MIYLCSVYSLEADETLMQKRYEYVAKRTAEFMKKGHTIFSPINHCHPIATKYSMPRTWEFWKGHDMNYIDASDEIWVLKMPGFARIVGVNAEVDYAMAKGKPVQYIACGDYSE